MALPEFRTIIIDSDAPSGTATLTMNRPAVLNAWTFEMLTEMATALELLARDEAVKVLIITGAGRGFSAGLDVSEDMAKISDNAPVAETSLGRFLAGGLSPANLVMMVYSFAKPTIAAVNGISAGGGVGLALACDILLGADCARFNMAFVKRGLVPDCAVSFQLPRLVGSAMAKELVFTGDTIDAHEAARIGLLNRVVAADDLLPSARALGARIAANPPLALKNAKLALQRGVIGSDIALHADYEVALNAALTKTADFHEGVRAFLEKRQPTFTGR